jgi:glutamyl-tRNA synthetase
MKVITRFPPSPTGYFHIGSARTALFNLLFARHEGGLMYLRFEDTDAARSKKEYEDDIVAGIAWLGIEYSASGVLRQSERTSKYRNYLKNLIDSGAAYEAEPSADNPEKKVVRFKNPNALITFHDLIRGDITFDTAELKDFVIAKNIDEPLYHLAVVVDDHETGVTHVIRGEDHISNTPRQILILEALGFERPIYAHLPLILAPDHSKLSKRHGAVSLREYRKQGYLPQALVNYLALLGWNPGGEQELFMLPELIEKFDIGHVQKGGAIFDIEKLTWFNHEHLKKFSRNEYADALRAYMKSYGREAVPYMEQAIEIIQPRAQTLFEAAELLYTECSFFADRPADGADYGADLLQKGAKTDAEAIVKHISQIKKMISDIPEEQFTPQAVKEAIFPYATEASRSAVLWPMRVALSGKEKSPDPFTIAGLIGKSRTLARLDTALRVLGAI